MNDEYDSREEEFGRPAGYPTKYSRAEGVGSYRRRRRRNRLFTAIVVVVVLAIVAGGVALFGRQLVQGRLPVFSAPQQTTEQSAVTTAQPEVNLVAPAHVSMLAAGDVIMNNIVIDSGTDYSGNYNFAHLFTPLKHELNGFDVRAVSQETALAGDSFGIGYSNPLNAPQVLGNAEVSAGFNVILRASDHSLDTGREGIHNELLWWQSNNPSIPVLGIAEPDRAGNPSLSDYVNNVYVFEKDGFKVAILNHTIGVGDEDQDVVSALTNEKIAADVARARELGAEMIVACPHWGSEGEDVTEEQTRFAQAYADQGVDVIVGTHPRVLQRVEVLTGPEGHKTVCYYSLGCLVSGLYRANMLGGLAEFTLARDSQGVCSVESAKLKPVVTNRASGTDYATYLVSDFNSTVAATNWDGLTHEALDEECRTVLGDGYDAEVGVLNITL